MNIFYCPVAELNETCILDEAESAHLIKVLRKRENDELFVFDGKGKLFEARIENVGKKETAVHVFRLVEVEESAPQLHIAIAPSKNKLQRLELPKLHRLSAHIPSARNCGPTGLKKYYWALVNRA